MTTLSVSSYLLPDCCSALVQLGWAVSQTESLIHFLCKYIAKATDENLTSENWEYILVWILLYLAFPSYVSILVPKLSLTDDVVCLDRYRMFVIRWLQKNQGRSLLILLFLKYAILTVLRYSAKDVVAALIKRLAHRNANVQLYTLEVCDNCGYRLLVLC